jgi:Flp pilus assembly protein TadD
VTDLEAVVAEFPRYYAARHSLADILFKTQRYREAIPHYAALHDQRPADVYPLLGLASSYSRLGDPAAAAPLMAELERRFPDNSEVLFECGRFAREQRDSARAEPLLRRAAELNPHDHEIRRELAVCLDELGKGAEAAAHLERFRQIEGDLVLLERLFADITKDQKDPKPRRRIGEVCLRNGQEAEGLRWLGSVLDMMPNDPQTHRILADYYAGKGDTELAGHHRRQAGFTFPAEAPTPPPKGGPS